MLTFVRSTIFNLYMPLTAIMTTLVMWPALFKREWARTVACGWAKVMLRSLKVICGLDYKILHPERIPQTPVLFAVKHQSMWETVGLASTLPKPCFILKKELLTIPVFGWWCRAAGFIGIDREAGSNAMRDMLTRAKARSADGYQMVIFPEGTRMAPGESGTYHPGVAGLYNALKLPCIPVAHNSGLFWTHPGISRKPGVISLSFEEPIEPGLKRRDFMARVQKAIETSTRHLAGLTPDTSGDQMPSGQEAENKATSG